MLLWLYIFFLRKRNQKEYLYYFSQGYLLFEVSKYSHSIRNQIANAKKIYVNDIGFARTLGFRISQDSGRFLENIIFVELMRKRKQIYYFSEKNECDFVVKEGIIITEAIQVCWELNEENKKRELKGLQEAMKKFKLKKGLILTYGQEEIIDKNITVVPVWKWLLQWISVF